MAENGKWRLWAHGLALLVLGLTALSVVAALRARAVERQLSAADAAMSDNPRRALALLDSLDADCLCGRAQQAKYALLYTQAQDKNYIDETNDSLIRVASEYYESRGSVRDRFRALYYRGRICVNRGEYSRAMIAFMEAELLVRDLHDDYLAGLLYVQMGNIYKWYYDYPKALKAYRTAYACYLNTNRELHQYHVLVDIALIHRRLKDYKLSESLLEQVLTYAQKTFNTSLQECGYGCLIMLYNDQQEFQHAKCLYEHVIPSFDFKSFSASFEASLAYMYAYCDEYQKASIYFQRAQARAVNQTDSIDLNYYNARICLKTGRSRNAYESLAHSTVLQDSRLRVSLQQPILSTQRDFLAAKLQHQAYKVLTERRLRIVYLVVAALLVSGLLFFLYSRIRRKNAMICRAMNMYDELQQLTQHTRSQMELQIHELFRQQFKLLNELGETYYAFSTKADNKEQIYKKVTSLLKPLSKNEKTFRELEAIINRYHGEAMRHIREEFPSWKEADFRLLCYRFAGFSANMISVVTGETIEQVYKHTSRLRMRIRISEVPHRDLYLRLFLKKLDSTSL